MIGLQSTSISPLPIAYKMTLIRIPPKGLGNRSGKTARPISPVAAHISDATTHMRYPVHEFCTEQIYQKLREKEAGGDQGNPSKRNLIRIVKS